MLAAVRAWLDNSRYKAGDNDQIDWLRLFPLILLHLAVVLVLWVGVSWIAVVVALLSYAIRMFGITAFYHRYFSHRSFKTTRVFQFLMAVLGASATQRGPIWWAAHHREHHRSADTDNDPHDSRRGFWWSHIGWFLTNRHYGTDNSRVADLSRYPELRWLDRFDMVVPVLYAASLYLLGNWLESRYPEFGTSGWQMVVWGYVISTIVLLHITLTINSLAHRLGSRRYDTADESRNNWLLALLTLGEGWHNNHHHYPGSARQGFYWWELDFSYYLLRALSGLGLIRQLREVPLPVRESQGRGRRSLR